MILYSQCLTQTLSKMSSISYMEGVLIYSCHGAHTALIRLYMQAYILAHASFI